MRNSALLHSALYTGSGTRRRNGLSSNDEWKMNPQGGTRGGASNLEKRSPRDRRGPSADFAGRANDYAQGAERSASGYRGGSAPLIVNYSPNVTLADASPGDMERRLVEAIGRHGSDLVRILNREMEKRQRAGF